MASYRIVPFLMLVLGCTVVSIQAAPPHTSYNPSLMTELSDLSESSDVYQRIPLSPYHRFLFGAEVAEFRTYYPLGFGVLGIPPPAQAGDLPIGDEISVHTRYHPAYAFQAAYLFGTNALHFIYDSYNSRDVTAVVAAANQNIWTTLLPPEFNEDLADEASGDFQFNIHVTDIFFSHCLNHFFTAMMGVSFASFSSLWTVHYAGGDIPSPQSLPVQWYNRISGTGLMLGVDFSYPIVSIIHVIGKTVGHVIYGKMTSHFFSHDANGNPTFRISVDGIHATYLPMLTTEVGVSIPWVLNSRGNQLIWRFSYQFNTAFNQGFLRTITQNRSTAITLSRNIVWSGGVAQLSFIF